MTADSLSRHFEDGIEWELNRSMLQKICGFYSVPQIELFASRINYQISTCASGKRDPHASYVDAFSVNWSQFTNSYISPLLPGQQMPSKAGSGARNNELSYSTINTAFVRVQLGGGLKLSCKHVDWIQKSLKLTALDQ